MSYHAGRGDFSRWVGSTLADQTLSRELAHIERTMATKWAAAVEEARQEIQASIRSRYLQA